MSETRVASTTAPHQMLMERGSWLLAFLLGWVALWLALGNPGTVANGTFAFDSDYPNAAAAFELFVRDSWRFPLGENPAFGGINLFFSDAAPWFALLAKAVHGMTGIFIPFDTLILVNFVLFSVMAHRWARRLSTDMQGRWLITVLLVFSLIMPVRTLGAQHIALSGYWVLLWAMCCVTPIRGNVPSLWQQWECVAVATMAFLTHSYLGSMATGFMLVALILQRHWRQAIAILIAPLLALYLFGFFERKYATIPWRQGIFLRSSGVPADPELGRGTQSLPHRAITGRCLRLSRYRRMGHDPDVPGGLPFDGPSRPAIQVGWHIHTPASHIAAQRLVAQCLATRYFAVLRRPRPRRVCTGVKSSRGRPGVGIAALHRALLDTVRTIPLSRKICGTAGLSDHGKRGIAMVTPASSPDICPVVVRLCRRSCPAGGRSACRK